MTKEEGQSWAAGRSLDVLVWLGRPVGHAGKSEHQEGEAAARREPRLPRGPREPSKQRWQCGCFRNTAVTQTSRNAVRLLRILAEESRKLLGLQTYQVSRAIAQNHCAFTGQVRLIFFGYQCQM